MNSDHKQPKEHNEFFQRLQFSETRLVLRFVLFEVSLKEESEKEISIFQVLNLDPFGSMEDHRVLLLEQTVCDLTQQGEIQVTMHGRAKLGLQILKLLPLIPFS